MCFRREFEAVWVFLFYSLSNSGRTPLYASVAHSCALIATLDGYSDGQRPPCGHHRGGSHRAKVLRLTKVRKEHCSRHRTLLCPRLSLPVLSRRVLLRRCEWRYRKLHRGHA